MSRDDIRNLGNLVRRDHWDFAPQVDELSGTVNNEPSKTRQSELDAADINKILKRFEKSGILPMTNREGAYLDVSEVGDYRSALEQVRKADEYFAGLPADSRAIFENDPAVFLDAVNDPTQLHKLVDAGVVPKDEVKAETPPRAASGSDVPPEGGVKGSVSP